MPDTPKYWSAIQSDLDKLEQDISRNCVKCNKWTYNPMYQYRLGATQQYAFSAKAANILLGYTG